MRGLRLISFSFFLSLSLSLCVCVCVRVRVCVYMCASVSLSVLSVPVSVCVLSASICLCVYCSLDFSLPPSISLLLVILLILSLPTKPKMPPPFLSLPSSHCPRPRELVWHADHFCIIVSVDALAIRSDSCIKHGLIPKLGTEGQHARVIYCLQFLPHKHLANAINLGWVSKEV